MEASLLLRRLLEHKGIADEHTKSYTENVIMSLPAGAWQFSIPTEHFLLMPTRRKSTAYMTSHVISQQLKKADGD